MERRLAFATATARFATIFITILSIKKFELKTSRYAPGSMQSRHKSCILMERGRDKSRPYEFYRRGVIYRALSLPSHLPTSNGHQIRHGQTFRHALDC